MGLYLVTLTRGGGRGSEPLIGEQLLASERGGSPRERSCPGWYCPTGDSPLYPLGHRNVVALPGGDLWVLTNNTDGRGSPKPGDDQILRVKPQSREPGSWVVSVYRTGSHTISWRS